jgi:Antibiotic biosynthesis monooxygenase
MGDEGAAIHIQFPSKCSDYPTRLVQRHLQTCRSLRKEFTFTRNLDKENKIVTLINVFTMEPAVQQRVVDMLVEATETLVEETEKTMTRLSSFLSASIPKSFDGLRVVNYAQWRSRADFEAMTKNPEAEAHLKP